MLRINVDKVCYVIDLAMQRSGKVPPLFESGGESPETSDDTGSDSPLAPIVEFPGDPTDDNLQDYLAALGDDELADLLALVWIGSGEREAEDWEEACDAADEETGRGDVVGDMMSRPHLAEHLIAGLQELGYECPKDSGAAGPG